MNFFERADADDAVTCPALVILDINLPKRQGDEVLRHIRNSRRCRDPVVVAVSTSESAQERDNMLRLGASRYFHKPSEFSVFMTLGPDGQSDARRAIAVNTDQTSFSTNDFNRLSALSHCFETRSRYSRTWAMGRGFSSNRLSRPE